MPIPVNGLFLRSSGANAIAGGREGAATSCRGWLAPAMLSGLLWTTMPPSASATEDDSVEQLIVHFRASDLTSTARAKALLGRIDDAALEVCGASPFSLAELQRAVVESPCWQDAVADAVGRIHSPELDAVFAQAERHHRRR